MVYSGGKGVSKMHYSQIKLNLFLNKKAPILIKTGAFLNKIEENKVKITLSHAQHILRFWY
jgi:hypothetical protein